MSETKPFTDPVWLQTKLSTFEGHARGGKEVTKARLEKPVMLDTDLLKAREDDIMASPLQVVWIKLDERCAGSRG